MSASTEKDGGTSHIETWQRKEWQTQRLWVGVCLECVMNRKKA